MTTLFAACAPGLEPHVEAELRALGSRGITPSDGGVEFDDGDDAIARANQQLECASRVLLRLGSFHAAAFPELRRKAAELPWHRILRRGQPVALRVTAHKSRLFHTGAIAERVAQAIGDALGAEPSVEKAHEDAEDAQPQLVVVRLQRDACTISADTSGALLHRRGYRQATGKAPLRETLACAMLRAASWKPGITLIDPFCGSGTIVLEAARIASGISAGSRRAFAFTRWPEPVRAPPAVTTESVPTTILASDLNHGALAASRANAARAEFPVTVSFTRLDAVELTPPMTTGLILTNPPYGHRVGEHEDLHALHRAFGRTLRERFKGWRVGMLSSDENLIRATGIAMQPALRTSNGGLRVTLFLGEV